MMLLAGVVVDGSTHGVFVNAQSNTPGAGVVGYAHMQLLPAFPLPPLTIALVSDNSPPNNGLQQAPPMTELLGMGMYNGLQLYDPY
jgi:hypothetical protein